MSVVEGDRLVVAGVQADRDVAGGGLSHADLLAALPGDLDHHLQVLGQKALGILPALTELLPPIGVPGPGLLDDAQVDGHVDERALPADPLAVHDVDLGLAERGRRLVLDHLHPGAVPDYLRALLDGFDPTDVETDRGVELQRPAARRGLGAAEHDADLLAQLVDEDGDGVGPVQRGCQLAQGLRHEPGLQPDVRVAHVTFDLGAGGQRSDRVDHDHVEGPGADQHVGYLQRLLAGVRLGDEEVVDVHPDGPGVHGVHGVLGVDVGADPTIALGLCHHVHGERGLAGGLGAKDLDDPPPGEAPDAKRYVERQRPRRDDVDLHAHVVAHAHDGTLAELLLDLAHGHLEGLVTLHRLASSHSAGWTLPGWTFAGWTVLTLRGGCDGHPPRSCKLVVRRPTIPPNTRSGGGPSTARRVVSTCHRTRPPSLAKPHAFTQVDGPLLRLPSLGTVLRRSPGEPPVHPTDPLVASLPVQRRLGSDGVAALVAAYREGVSGEDLAATFGVNRTTVLGHVRRNGVPKRDRRALRGADLDRAIERYAEGRSGDWVAGSWRWRRARCASP